jgi:hypothetical protein
VTKIIPSKIGNVPQVGVVLGDKPYYLTTHRNNLTQEENQKIKENLEDRFVKAGCKSTITLHGDGHDDFEKYGISNNMSETIYSSLK